MVRIYLSIFIIIQIFSGFKLVLAYLQNLYNEIQVLTAKQREPVFPFLSNYQISKPTVLDFREYSLFFSLIP